MPRKKITRLAKFAMFVEWLFKHWLGKLASRKKKLVSERLAFLGIMGEQLKASLKPLSSIVCCDGPMGLPKMTRDGSLSDS